MTHYDITLMTMQGRNIHPTPTMSRTQWLKRYLAERAGFEWTQEYRARQAELATLEAGK